MKLTQLVLFQWQSAIDFRTFLSALQDKYAFKTPVSQVQNISESV